MDLLGWKGVTGSTRSGLTAVLMIRVENSPTIYHIEILGLAMTLFLTKTFLIFSLHNEGNLLTPGCSVEPLCRNYTTFGETFCMRDHYYELWDLEKNFGEKTLCEDNLRHPGKNPNIPLEEMIFGEYRPRGPEKESERKFDVGVGKESTPYGVVLNDCCVLKISGGKTTKNIPDPCSQKFRFDSSDKALAIFKSLTDTQLCGIFAPL